MYFVICVRIYIFNFVFYCVNFRLIMPLFKDNVYAKRKSIFNFYSIRGYVFKKSRKEPAQPSYSRLFAFVYILNLIVGVGAIAMPKAFAMAGWLLGLVLLIVLAMLSYMTATYVIEAMATANAYASIKRKERERAYSYAVVVPRSIQVGDQGTVPEASFLHVSQCILLITTVHIPWVRWGFF